MLALSRRINDCLVVNQKDVIAFAHKGLTARWLCVDTEFVHERTYWPCMGLIQCGLPDGQAALFDPLDNNLDLTPIYALLQDKKLVKVFHDPSQDIVILHRLIGAMISPVFDTQIGAMLCGMGASMALSSLAKKLLHINMDKQERRSDWLRRPLDNKQLTYAINDVIVLNQVYRKLHNLLVKCDRLEWAMDESNQTATNVLEKRLPSHQSWQSLRLQPSFTRQCRDDHLGRIRALAQWREAEAQKQDIPRRRVLDDRPLLAIAAKPSTMIEQLNRHPINLQKAVQNVLDNVSKTPVALTPRSPPPNNHLVSLLNILLKVKCDQHRITTRVVATRQDLENFAINPKIHTKLVTGWRRHIFGDDAISLKEGRISLKATANGAQIIPAI